MVILILLIYIIGWFSCMILLRVVNARVNHHRTHEDIEIEAFLSILWPFLLIVAIADKIESIVASK